ncbi:MAG: sigma-54-dependent Fis family transcriptional regulator [Desulfobacterales bacterium]|nr:sigma-54-dependent Fis family transcriptional regulator [Desulfobacterales bacterium]
MIDRAGAIAGPLEAALASNGFKVDIHTPGPAALEQVDFTNYRIAIADTDLPGLDYAHLLSTIGSQAPHLPVIATAEAGSVRGAVEAMQAGAVDYLLKPCNPQTLVLAIQKALAAENATCDHPATPRLPASTKQIVTRDPKVFELLKLAENVAKSRATVLILGESGTGKELLAAYIHHHSRACENPFVALNCAALPEQLAESELFGHEKGAFTGAVSRKTGKFELARNGTLLLDEISEMALPLQAKLLRVLQEKEIDRVGGSEPVRVATRVIAVTNVDLKQAVEAGEFRKDLYYRINVIPFTLPPLRQRPADIVPLAEHFIQKYCRENQKAVQGLSANASRKLQAYAWPGNIRELENTMERAVIITSGKMIPASQIYMEDEDPAVANTIELRPGMSVKEMEKELIARTLRKVNDNRTQAADMLGISIRTLRNKLKEYREKNAA